MCLALWPREHETVIIFWAVFIQEIQLFWQHWRPQYSAYSFSLYARLLLLDVVVGFFCCLQCKWFSNKLQQIEDNNFITKRPSLQQQGTQKQMHWDTNTHALMHLCIHKNDNLKNETRTRRRRPQQCCGLLAVRSCTKLSLLCSSSTVFVAAVAVHRNTTQWEQCLLPTHMHGTHNVVVLPMRWGG